MIRLEKSIKRFFFDYGKVETHLAHMRKKN